MKLEGEKVFLDVLEKEDCNKLWNEFEYDFQAKTEPLNIGHSSIKAEKWFEDIQREQGEKSVRLGIFTIDGIVIGDVALQDIDWKNRSCFFFFQIIILKKRGKGYGSEAVRLIMEYGFNNLGVERITANTLEHNKAAQYSLERNGFLLEGTEREAVYFAGKRWNKLNYGLLRDEFNR